MKKYQSYRCNVCGNSVEVQEVGGGALHCCGEAMECMTPEVTLINLMKAFAGESQARNRYEYFAKVAQKEGYRDIAAHFQRAANNEKEHAKLELALYNRLKNAQVESFGTTAENLQEAMNGEKYENSTMYPDFAALAKEEGYKEAARLFTLIGKVEEEHEKMYKMLLERLEQDYEFQSDEEEAWICEVCGHVHYGKKAPQKCPVCGHPQAYQSRLKEVK